ncbi:MAG: hypothetical protein PHU71_03330 [Candidatus Gracilibacteria bacterium]|nr:hypothetical protein [Candidatus Gracilibacteria bacterium]
MDHPTSVQESHGYLDFSQEERTNIWQAIIATRPQEISKKEAEKRFKFPEDTEALEILMLGSPMYFDSKKLLELAIHQPEFAPKLTAELAKRGAYPEILTILEHHKYRRCFNSCVLELENMLEDNKDRDNILNYFYKEMSKSQNRSMQVFSEYMLSKPEAASRNLKNYQTLLGIDDKKLQTLLHGKSLLMIGGGLAPIKDSLKAKNIDCKITNIEPLLNADTSGNSDQAIAQDFYDVDLKSLGKFEEVWSANNSLPTYAWDPEQVKIFYKKSLQAVAQKGHLRILPVYDFLDSITPAMRLNRIPVNNMSKRCLDMIKQRPDLFRLIYFSTAPEKKMLAFKKSSMQGVDIEVIGNSDDIQDFLRTL